MRNRTWAALAALLLAGCVTPAGIVDDWRPPQAAGTTGDQRVVCTTVDENGKVVEVAPCTTEVVALRGTETKEPFKAKAPRPSPPRRWR